jgi:hypothetical protein
LAVVVLLLELTKIVAAKALILFFQPLHLLAAVVVDMMRELAKLLRLVVLVVVEGLTLGELVLMEKPVKVTKVATMRPLR